jgi:hypothetical protein
MVRALYLPETIVDLLWKTCASLQHTIHISVKITGLFINKKIYISHTFLV